MWPHLELTGHCVDNLHFVSAFLDDRALVPDVGTGLELHHGFARELGGHTRVDHLAVLYVRPNVRISVAYRIT